MNSDKDESVIKPTIASGTLAILYNGIFAYFFYIYAFQNPDEGNCFAKEYTENGYPSIPMTTTGFGNEQTNTPQEGFLDMTERF